MTPHNDVFEDIEQVTRLGADGIGLYEGKLTEGDDEAIRDALVHSGLAATFCIPRLWTFLAGPVGGSTVERDPKARLEMICESIPRLATFSPLAIVVGPGTSGDASVPAGPLEAVAEGLATVADLAREHGVRVAFELLTARRGSPLPWLPEIVEFIDEVGRDNVGVLFDVWHSWIEPDLHEHLRTYADRIDCVHVNDVRVEERTWADRVLPGEGRDVAVEMIAALIEADYQGWYELEIVSDDGTYGIDLPDSLWKMPHAELLERGTRAFQSVYARATRLAGSRSTDSTPTARVQPAVPEEGTGPPAGG
jgi:sugar phosphate isomerase/epimerase